jgi:hypothetical protein
MSIGKVSEVKKWLEANGFIETAVDSKSGNLGYQVTSTYKRSPCEQIQQERSPHEHQRSRSEHQRSPHELKTITLRQEQEEEGRADPLTELVDYFLAESHCRKPRNGEYRERWLEPIVAIYKAAGDDFEETKRRIKESINLLRKDGLTVANPGSIQNAAVGPIHSNGHNPQVSKTDIAKLFVDAASKYGRQPLKARESLGEHWPLIQHVKGGWSHLSKQSPDNIKFAIFSALKETS